VQAPDRSQGWSSASAPPTSVKTGAAIDHQRLASDECGIGAGDERDRTNEIRGRHGPSKDAIADGRLLHAQADMRGNVATGSAPDKPSNADNHRTPCTGEFILSRRNEHTAVSAPRAARKGEAWWARQDSNLQPDRYERPALTIELRARGRLLVADCAAAVEIERCAVGWATAQYEGSTRGQNRSCAVAHAGAQ
jgi:hypothetical protein